MSSVSDVAVSVLLGGLLAAGLLLVLAAFPRWRWADLSTRIAPYVRDVADLTDPTARLPWRMPGGGSWAARLTRAFGSFGGDTGVTLRMSQAGLPGGSAGFRSGQLVWVLCGLGAGAAATVVLVMIGRLSAPAVLLPVLTAVTAGACCDALLGVRAKARVRRLTEELPTVLEFLALCLSAGEGLPEGLRRVGHAGSGELSGELRGVILAVNTGSTLVDALSECARRLQVPPLTRAADQIIAALERGAPLAAVLQAQASDAREETKRDLIEQAGRKEILMMLPLVFLILPLSVLFAVFPGIFILRLGIG
ncbi:MAG: type II secretion system F family protein [Microbacterium sp.]|jgi:tight adherence protein C|uniref:type II secretion system F family protein n=1 Tax=Microbacterium sp. TaxID=51671 RepID=UPI00282615BB|nr:type II secretion system F family protein [Microbacterium sp.]MDR2320258.1 type II secretion system F family protein [Microbacterium sp.]